MATVNDPSTERSIAPFEVLAPATVQLAIRSRDGRVFKVKLDPLILNVLEEHPDPREGDDEKPLFRVVFDEAAVVGGDPDSAIPEAEGG